MQKFTILFLVLCAVILVSAAPAKKGAKIHKKHHHHHKSKSGKLVNQPKHHRSGKITVYEDEITRSGEILDQEILDIPVSVEKAISGEVIVLDVNEDEAAAVPEVIVFDAETPEGRAVSSEEDVLTTYAEVPSHPAGSFFNTHLDDAEHGTFALANSYSTGKKGSALSTSIAHAQQHVGFL